MPFLFMPSFWSPPNSFKCSGFLTKSGVSTYSPNRSSKQSISFLLFIDNKKNQIVMTYHSSDLGPSRTTIDYLSSSLVKFSSKIKNTSEEQETFSGSLNRKTNIFTSTYLSRSRFETYFSDFKIFTKASCVADR